MSGIIGTLRFLLLLVLTNSTSGYLLPLPLGKHNVTLTTGPLIDYSRRNTSFGTPRELMISIYQPATCNQTIAVPYMPTKTAEYQTTFLQEIFGLSGNFTPLFQEARLQVCPDHPTSWASCDPPILLFSPGYSVNRLYYNIIAASIASEGFIVVTIDHPGDANIITYPDGHTIYLSGPYANTTSQFTKLQAPRVADLSFVLDQLSNATAIASLLPSRGPKPFSTSNVAAFGQSLGGSSAISALSQDSRLRAAIDFDGTIFGTPSTSKPVLLVSRNSSADGIDPTWTSTWPRLTGPKLWAEVNNTSHYTFSDFPTLLQAAGEDLADYASLINTILPREMMEIMTVFTTSWVDVAFEEGERGDVEERLSEFPEVSIVDGEL